MSNPHNFVREANLKNIRPEYLIEAKHCIGGQSLARMFSGVSSRGKIGCLSSQTIEVWLNTFKYSENNPEIKDSDQYTARRLEPTVEYKCSGTPGGFTGDLLTYISEDLT